VSDTRRRILDTALRLFNEQGLGRIGVRDVARAAGISAGNLSYHFATKDELVAALVLELHEVNQQQIFVALPPGFSLVALYRSAVAAMRNMLAYRFVLLSYVDAVGASPPLAALEADLARRRWHRHREMLALLVDNGFVERAVSARSERLWEQGALIASGWLAAATVRGWSDERAVLHFAKLGCALLESWCTPKGARQLRRILAGDEDGGR
jgi:AcrR family transcriptional regulator